MLLYAFSVSASYQNVVIRFLRETQSRSGLSCLQAAKQAEAFELVHPHDRYGKAIADRHCTKEVEEALNEYRYACDAAHVAVRAQLKLLADTLQVNPTALCAVLRCAVLGWAVLLLCSAVLL